MLASFWRGAVNGLVGGMSWFGRREMRFFSELTTAKNSLGTEAATACMATVCVISFHCVNIFFGEAGNALFTIGT